MDREKVISDLQEQIDWIRDNEFHKFPGWGHAVLAMKDAIALLKEQEEKQTPKPIIHGYKEEYWGEEEICPVCGKRWQSAYIDSTHFCPGCGQAVIWEDT